MPSWTRDLITRQPHTSPPPNLSPLTISLLPSISDLAMRPLLLLSHILHTPRRVFTLQAQKMSTGPNHNQPSPALSSNYDPTQAARDLEPLLKASGGNWALNSSGQGVERSFKFKTFKKTWACHLSLLLLFLDLASRHERGYGCKRRSERVWLMMGRNS